MGGTFEDFLAALLAFESGWDRERYEAGTILDWQLDEWARGSVSDFFPNYSSWSELTDAEWETMAYRSMNSLGFVGFQFGEALLIDLGYYDDTVFYGAGAATNTWDGTWTGKNGVSSLEEFMTKDAQSVAIREAFGYNLQILQNQLANSGNTLEDYIGQSASYVQNGQTVTVELTLTGILAAAHLRGAWGTASLLQSGSVSTDEYGTSILQYIEQFGSYESPAISELVAFYEERLTGDEGLGSPGEAPVPGSGDGPTGSAGVTDQDADVVITWSWGKNENVTDFDPATGTIFIDWIDAGDLDVRQTAEGVVFAVPSNSQSVTLANVTLSELSADNFTIRDAGTAAKVLALVGTGEVVPDAPTAPDTPDTPDDPEGPSVPDGPDKPDTPATPDEPDEPDAPTAPVASENSNGLAQVTAATATLVLTWSWGVQKSFADFDPNSDTIFIDWFSPDAISVSEVDGNVVFSIPSNNQTVTLEGVALSDLSTANFTIMSEATGQMILSQVGAGQGPGDAPVPPQNPDGGQTPLMVMITPESTSTVIENFNPAGDMVHLEAGVIAERLDISDQAAGLQITVYSETGAIASQTTLAGVVLSDLSMNNFMVAEQSALNEVAALLGQVVVVPASGGFDVVYDTDGSNPPVPSGPSDRGGVKWAADFGADDIVGFNPATDEIDFGNASVHGLIMTMTPNGEAVIDNPWGPDMQILQGVQVSDLTVANLGVVGNEHLRQDLGGILSWEAGVGPRESGTVYVRSHEYGVSEVINDFDPSTNKISFLYFGTRERLSVEDTSAGLVISSLPSGQSVTLTGVSKSDLVPGNLEFHHDQVMEDNLEAAFGVDQETVALVSREALLTPAAPPGQTTDGFQVRDGSGNVPDTGTPAPDTPDTPSEPATPVAPQETDDAIVLGAGADTVNMTWDWGRTVTVQNFNVADDIFNFGALAASDLKINENGSDLVVTVLNNGGHMYVFEDLQAEDLSIANLTAASWNTVATDAGGVVEQLVALGNQDLII